MKKEGKGRKDPWKGICPIERKALLAMYLRVWMSVGGMMLSRTCWPFQPY